MKQTARNNEFLEEVKVVVNNKIYKEVLRIYNEQGMEQTIEYLNQFFNWKNIEKHYISPPHWFYEH